MGDASFPQSQEHLYTLPLFQTVKENTSSFWAYSFSIQNDPVKKDLRKEETEGNIRKECAGLNESSVSCFCKRIQEAPRPRVQGENSDQNTWLAATDCFTQEAAWGMEQKVVLFDKAPPD